MGQGKNAQVLSNHPTYRGSNQNMRYTVYNRKN